VAELEHSATDGSAMGMLTGHIQSGDVECSASVKAGRRRAPDNGG
jgi:hypothetical protein